MQRRNVILSGVCFATASWLAIQNRILASSQEAIGNDLYRPLVDVLMQINNPVTKRVAGLLDYRLSKSNSYNLHLRGASLNTADAGLIAEALSKIHDNQHFKLMSFSMSYNPDIGNLGVGKILNALPDNTTELGLVGCNLGDNASSHIVAFIQHSKTLRMVCAEDNHFSSSVKMLIRRSTKHLSGCVTIV
jgi:hypothetical protein